MSLYDAGRKKKNQKLGMVGLFIVMLIVLRLKLGKKTINVNVNSVGTYAFLYETTSSIGTTTTGAQINNYITGSKVETNGGGIRLDISPVAWRRKMLLMLLVI